MRLSLPRRLAAQGRAVMPAVRIAASWVRFAWSMTLVVGVILATFAVVTVAIAIRCAWALFTLPTRVIHGRPE